MVSSHTSLLTVEEEVNLSENNIHVLSGSDNRVQASRLPVTAPCSSWTFVVRISWCQIIWVPLTLSSKKPYYCKIFSNNRQTSCRLKYQDPQLNLYFALCRPCWHPQMCFSLFKARAHFISLCLNGKRESVSVVWCTDRLKTCSTSIEIRLWTGQGRSLKRLVETFFLCLYFHPSVCCCVSICFYFSPLFIYLFIYYWQ